MPHLRVILLGTGTSHGIPMIGCDCAVCRSTDPHDRRMRSSILIRIDDHNVLIDTTPELRLQCLANDIRSLEAVLFTHAHADHVVGLDDLRRFNHLQRRILTCYADAATGGALRRMFTYAFDDSPNYPSSKPQLQLEVIDGPIELFGVRVVPLLLYHGAMPVLGFRVGRFAYCTDCSRIPPESMALLEGLDVLVLDALRHRPHPTHFNLTQALEAAQQIRARQTWLTHIAHELPHEETNRSLPPDIQLGHDGQVIELG